MWNGSRNNTYEHNCLDIARLMLILKPTTKIRGGSLCSRYCALSKLDSVLHNLDSLSPSLLLYFHKSAPPQLWCCDSGPQHWSGTILALVFTFEEQQLRISKCSHCSKLFFSRKFLIRPVSTVNEKASSRATYGQINITERRVSQNFP